MAVNNITFNPTRIRACTTSDNNRSNSNRSNTTGSPNWWSPIFGWSNEPEYIDDEPEKTEVEALTDKKVRFVPGSFTAEKAKQLRLMTHGKENYQDVMYHSAIASRLASDFKRREDNGDDL
ncbi:hypothetical protein ACFE04_021391 [Oxalis oulophora]